jgi:hypothetical protein
VYTNAIPHDRVSFSVVEDIAKRYGYNILQSHGNVNTVRLYGPPTPSQSQPTTIVSNQNTHSLSFEFYLNF